MISEIAVSRNVSTQRKTNRPGRSLSLLNGLRVQATEARDWIGVNRRHHHDNELNRATENKIAICALLNEFL